MGRRQKKIGICRLCGMYGPLSFEHVPPEAAFNDSKYYYSAKMEEIIKLGDSDFDILTFKNKKNAKKKQGGIGFYTLCVKCNNNTGSWYGNAFVEWVYQSMAIILKANRNPTLFYPTFIFPLRIIKQIITMFLSVEHEGFTDRFPYFRKFILNKEDKFLPKDFRVFCYYNIEGSNRYLESNVVGHFTTGSIIKMSEITFPPLGFVLTIDSAAPDERLTEITHFSTYGFNEWIDHFQKFPTLPTYLPMFPGDYRKKEDIIKDMKLNLRLDRGD